MTARFSLLGVPSAAGTHGPGQERAPAALRAAGLVARLMKRGAEVDGPRLNIVDATGSRADPPNSTDEF
jgi:arginase family enzyme